MRVGNRTKGTRLRVVLAPNVAVGPGKADLLGGIAATGSIAAAGRQLGMSYKRAWSLVEELNRDFETPLVSTAKGGKAGGGAGLTDLGREVLGLYRRMEAKAQDATRDEFGALQRLLPEPVDDVSHD